MAISSKSEEAEENESSAAGCALLALGLAGVVIALCLLLEIVSWVAPWSFPFWSGTGSILGTIVILGIAVAMINATSTSSPSDDLGDSKPSEYYEAMRDQSIYVTNWQDAERSARDFMRANGYPGATLTNPGADGGVDVVAAGAIAQVKHYNTPIGEPAIVQLAGTTMRPQYQGREALFFSSSGYTAKATTTGRDLGVTLYKLNNSLHWVRVY
ncbi:restriction endonuclease [Kocuria sp. CPCC 205292]|uniref:restriction endonuclease n=1 Tax=Kocuria cellulosilytica TaxID=3071451 RepID=UPI0034D61882